VSYNSTTVSSGYVPRCCAPRRTNNSFTWPHKLFVRREQSSYCNWGGVVFFYKRKNQIMPETTFGRELQRIFLKWGRRHVLAKNAGDGWPPLWFRFQPPSHGTPWENGANSSKQGRAKPSEYWDGCRWGKYFWAKWVDDGDLKNITLGFCSCDTAFWLRRVFLKLAIVCCWVENALLKVATAVSVSADLYGVGRLKTEWGQTFWFWNGCRWGKYFGLGNSYFFCPINLAHSVFKLLARCRVAEIDAGVATSNKAFSLKNSCSNGQFQKYLPEPKAVNILGAWVEGHIFETGRRLFWSKNEYCWFQPICVVGLKTAWGQVDGAKKVWWNFTKFRGQKKYTVGGGNIFAADGLSLFWSKKNELAGWASSGVRKKMCSYGANIFANRWGLIKLSKVL